MLAYQGHPLLREPSAAQRHTVLNETAPMRAFTGAVRDLPMAVIARRQKFKWAWHFRLAAFDSHHPCGIGEANIEIGDVPPFLGGRDFHEKTNP